MDIRDSIEEKYTNYLNCETDNLDLTIEEAKFILTNDENTHFVDDLLYESYKVVLSELEKKNKIIDEQLNENEELRKNIKELEEKVIELKSEIAGKVYWASTPVKEIEKMWIPKQKIKDKIEEINKAYEDSKNEYGESEYYYPDYTIQVLEEILEGRKVRCIK